MALTQVSAPTSGVTPQSTGTDGFLEKPRPVTIDNFPINAHNQHAAHVEGVNPIGAAGRDIPPLSETMQSGFEGRPVLNTLLGIDFPSVTPLFPRWIGQVFLDCRVLRLPRRLESRAHQLPNTQPGKAVRRMCQLLSHIGSQRAETHNLVMGGRSDRD